MRNGFFIDTLTSVDGQEIVKIGGEAFQIYEGDIYQGDFKISPFKKVTGKVLALGRKYKDEGNVLMLNLVEVIMNSLFGVQI